MENATFFVVTVMEGAGLITKKVGGPRLQPTLLTPFHEME
jgi:hypothetical protein